MNSYVGSRLRRLRDTEPVLATESLGASFSIKLDEILPSHRRKTQFPPLPPTAVTSIFKKHQTGNLLKTSHLAI